jgi:hypothetical protein
VRGLAPQTQHVDTATRNPQDSLRGQIADALCCMATAQRESGVTTDGSGCGPRADTKPSKSLPGHRRVHSVCYLAFGTRATSSRDVHVRTPGSSVGTSAGRRMDEQSRRRTQAQVAPSALFAFGIHGGTTGGSLGSSDALFSFHGADPWPAAVSNSHCDRPVSRFRFPLGSASQSDE